MFCANRRSEDVKTWNEASSLLPYIDLCVIIILRLSGPGILYVVCVPHCMSNRSSVHRCWTPMSDSYYLKNAVWFNFLLLLLLLLLALLLLLLLLSH